jgi:hypothetical protein
MSAPDADIRINSAPRHRRPRVVQVANYLVTPTTDAPPSLVRLLIEIGDRWRHLAFTVVSAVTVADTLRHPKGSA